MKNVRVFSLMILSLTLVWTFAGQSQPAPTPETAEAALTSTDEAVQTVDPLVLLEGQDALADAVARSGDPTCIFPNCQPGPQCVSKCRNAYYACLGYCPSRLICRSLYSDCVDCCG